jgi:hypothetical protein
MFDSVSAIALEESVLFDVVDPATAWLLFPTTRDEAGRRYRLCLRPGFFQIPDLWLRSHPASSFPELPAEGPHPLRPPQPEGLVYARRDPAIGMTVAFEAVEIERDLDLFYAWMNDGRVAFFWEPANPREDLRAYLERLQADPHAFGLIGSFDGEKAGYFEVYWGRGPARGAVRRAPLRSGLARADRQRALSRPRPHGRLAARAHTPSVPRRYPHA